MTRRSTRLSIAAASQLLLFTLVFSFTPSTSSQTQSSSTRPTGVLRLRVRVKIDEATKGLSRKRFYLIKGTLEQNTPVLEAAKELAGGDGRAFDAIELYSCFPCVPKMARRTLGLGADVQPTVTGGLTFFGAPLNTYMTHAACAMVRKLRAGATLGLLYGQGGFVTKHHALVLSRTPPEEPLAQETSVQAEAERRRGGVPEFVTEASGKGKVESFTVLYGRNNEVGHGVSCCARRRTGGRWRACRPVTAAHSRIY